MIDAGRATDPPFLRPLKSTGIREVIPSLLARAGTRLDVARLVRGGTALALSLTFAPTHSAHAASPAPKILLLDAALSGPEVVAVGERAAILRSADGGRTWERIGAPTKATLTGIAFSPPPTAHAGWAVGHDALILATADGGKTWAKQYQGENLQDSFLDVIALDAQRAIAVGAYGLYVTTADGGKTWTRRKLNQDDYHFNRLAAGAGTTLYLAGEHGTLLRSTDHGARWSALKSPYDGSFYGLTSPAARTLLAHGLRGRIYRSTDDARSWQPIVTPELGLLATGIRHRSGALFLGGQSRSLLVSRDAGATFAVVPDALPAGIAELLELPDGSLLAFGEAGATLLELTKVQPGPPTAPAPRAP